jgi:hypothetical protein
MSDCSTTVHIPYDVWSEIAKHDTTRTLPVTCSALRSISRGVPREVSVTDQFSQVLTYFDGVVRIPCERQDTTATRASDVPPKPDFPSVAARGVHFPKARKLVLYEPIRSSRLTTADLDAISSIVNLSTLTSLAINAPWDICEAILGRINPESCALASLALLPTTTPVEFALSRTLVARLTKLKVSFDIYASSTTSNPNIQTLCAQYVVLAEDDSALPRDDVRALRTRGYDPEALDNVSSMLSTLIKWYPSIRKLHLGVMEDFASGAWQQPDSPTITREDLALARGGCRMPARIYEAAVCPGMYVNRRMARSIALLPRTNT